MNWIGTSFVRGKAGGSRECAPGSRTVRDVAEDIRLLFVVSTILPGPQFVVYIALWVLIPSNE